MRLRIHDRRLLPDLLAFLAAKGDTIITPLTEDEIEVSFVSSMNAEAHARDLVLRVGAWEEARRLAGCIEVLE